MRNTDILKAEIDFLDKQGAPPAPREAPDSALWALYGVHCVPEPPTPNRDGLLEALTQLGVRFTFDSHSVRLDWRALERLLRGVAPSEDDG
jgi:hypothetical protein